MNLFSGFIVALKCYPIELVPLVLLLLLLLLYVGAYISCEGNVMIHEIRLPMPSIAIVVVVQFKWWRYPPSRPPPFPEDSTTNPTWRFLEKYISLHPESTNKRTHTLWAKPVMGFISVPSISGIYLCHHQLRIHLLPVVALRQVKYTLHWVNKYFSRDEPILMVHSSLRIPFVT